MEGQSQNEKRQVELKTGENTLSSFSVFGNNEHLVFVYKKTEKLATAVYMITNFIKDNDPLKWKIRENVVKILSLNAAFATVSLSERKNFIKQYQALSLEIISLFAIAHHSGIVSEMNFTILSREFNNLISMLEKGDDNKLEETVVLHPGFFNVEGAPHENKSRTQTSAVGESVLYSQKATDSEKKEEFSKGQLANQPVNQGFNSTYSGKREYLPVKDSKESVSKTSDSKDSRQAIIIKLLSKKSGLNVNDFVESIKGVSVKTIQRELLSMVAAGILKKEGERRWSTYSMAK